MIQINPREVAAEAMVQILAEGAYNNTALRRLLRQNGAMSQQDRAFVTEIVNGTLRNIYYVDYVIDQFSNTKLNKIKPWLLAVLRTAVYQMLFMDVPDNAACNEAVKLATRVQIPQRFCQWRSSCHRQRKNRNQTARKRNGRISQRCVFPSPVAGENVGSVLWLRKDRSTLSGR